MALALYALYWVVAIVEPQSTASLPARRAGADVPRDPARGRRRGRRRARLGAGRGLGVALAWPILDRADFPTARRRPPPSTSPAGAGVLLVLEATRRTAGWVLPRRPRLPRLRVPRPAVRPGGPGRHRAPRLLPRPAHRHAVMTLEDLRHPAGRGGHLHHPVHDLRRGARASGAARFFIDLSFAALGRRRPGPAARSPSPDSSSAPCPAAASRPPSPSAARLAPAEEGGLSGRAGGGVLAAAGIGAILSPPTLGAAAFLIAELLQVSYLQVLVWPTIPTILYYLAFLTIEMDARRQRPTRSSWRPSPPGGCCSASATTSARSSRSSSSWCSATAVPRRVCATALAFLLSFLDRAPLDHPDAGAVGVRTAPSVRCRSSRRCRAASSSAS